MLTGIDYAIHVLKRDERLLIKEYKRVSETVLPNTTSWTNDPRDVILENIRSIRFALKLIDPSLKKDA